MKQIVLACLLVALQPFCAEARAYEADIHYSATYVLARAAGWTDAEALTIASANDGVDENEHTIAALEMEAIPRASLAGYVASSVRQAEKNLRFHCFSRIRGQAGQLSRDVLDVMALHFGKVPDHDDDPRENTTRLIALGVALHCQQDAHAHVEFGGSCGPHAGSCFGHTHESVLDDVVFRLLGKHYFNPDHPGVSGAHLLETLQGTARELAARSAKDGSRPIPRHELVALSDALRVSGLELPDDLRRNCNRYIAGKWLFERFRSGNQAKGGADNLQVLDLKVAVDCKNASLASATVIRIPDPRFPRLNADASPFLVKADGTYERVREGSFAGFAPTFHVANIALPVPDRDARKVRFQLSHWRQLLALLTTAAAKRSALPAANGKNRLGSISSSSSSTGSPS